MKKKFLSLCVSAALAVSSIPFFNVFAVGEDELDSIVVLGDSIAAGYGLDPKTEYNYGQIIGDYLGADVANYAVSGHTTVDLINTLDSLNDAQKDTLKNTDVVVVSIGGNDIMHCASNDILDFIKRKSRSDKKNEWKWFNEGYSEADIPEDPSITDLIRLANLDGEKGLLEHAKKDNSFALELNSLIGDISGNLRVVNEDEGYTGQIPQVIIPNIKNAVSKIRAINPDARIIVQTIYQPIQFDPAMVKGLAFTEYTALNLIRSNFEKIMDEFRRDLKNISGIEVADVYETFTSIEDLKDPTNDLSMANSGNAYHFTKIFASGNERDFHPNQKGHLAIATTVLDTIGINKGFRKNELLIKVFNTLSVEMGKVVYPKFALESFEKLASLPLGDVNLDGIVDQRDATRILVHSTKIESTGGRGILLPAELLVGNVNKDALIDARDATTVLRYSTHVSTGANISLEDFIKNDKK